MPKSPEFEMRFDLGNAEFDEPSARAEGIGRILRDTAAKIESGQSDGYLFDINGNKVGYWSFDQIEPEDEPDDA